MTTQTAAPRRVQKVLCIGCPTGCNGEVILENGAVVDTIGYTCDIGRALVAEEVIAPKRTVTTTVRVQGGALALLPVVSDRPVPKESIFATVAALRKLTVTAPIAADSVILADTLGLGVNFIASRDCPRFDTPAWVEAEVDDAPDPAIAAADEELEIELADNDDAPWHVLGLSVGQRMAMAAGKPIAMRMMAATAQEDCRKCGYDCAGYANALVLGDEKKTTLCEPGGKETARLLKQLVAEAGASRATPATPARQDAPAALPEPVVTTTQSLKATWHIAFDISAKKALGRDFILSVWDLLLRGDDISRVLQQFIWNAPLRHKFKFIEAIDKHLSDRYPMFKGLSKGWPTANHIIPYVRPAEERKNDFDLVTTGYLGYRELGYSMREVDLFVWLEVLRDKQCDDRPCELGCVVNGLRVGGCPVVIHIPDMVNLLGQGKLKEALELIQDCNPLPNVTGRVCPQEHQCQGACKLVGLPLEIGQLEWYLPERQRQLELESGVDESLWKDHVSPWQTADKPPIAVVGSGPAGLINAYLLSAEGYPVTVFEAFHDLGGVLRYGIPEFRLPNGLIDDVVKKIDRLGGKFVRNFVVGKTATLQDLRDAGFSKIFVGTGAGLPRFMNIPGEHLNGVMSANEFLTRVNLMQARDEDHETPLPAVRGQNVIVIGGGNTAMDAARTSKRLGGNVTIVYRRTKKEMPARVEELAHALEEGIELMPLRAPREFTSGGDHHVCHAILEVMELGAPDASGRRKPVPTGKTETIKADLVIMALGNDANPIIKDSEPRIKTSKWGTIVVEGGETSLAGVYSGGDATRGGSTAINAAGDGKAAAEKIAGDISLSPTVIKNLVASALAYTEKASAAATLIKRTELSPGIVEFTVNAPMIARSARAGQFVRVLPTPKGELIPLTIADWDEAAGTIDLVIQGVGTSSILMNEMSVGEAFAGVAGPLGQPSKLHRYEGAQTVVFCAGGLGLPPVYPIMREHLRMGNHVTLIAGYRSRELMFWTGEGERIDGLLSQFGAQFDVITTTNDGSYGVKGFVTTPLKAMLDDKKSSKGRAIAEVIAIGPPLMMRAVSELTKNHEVPTVVSLNSIMVDATGMCGACMVPVTIDGKLVRKHACIDGPELDAHIIDWDKFLPRFDQFREQEHESRVRHHLDG
ncbi:MAG: sulfide/dihydroorotate dehydrogenase-like FAD/NAD-binding protein [Alphaproteobacteria bacterium]|nr:sulfide/dihydroorotate dehydrogenase-like FAD/NAD-binding protein [Alphaproteobacteria bacterium]